IDPCADRPDSDYLIAQAQVNALGAELTQQIVAVDEAQYGPIGEAEPGDPASKSLVMLVYNVLDSFTYDCAATTYTAGYFAPGYIDQYGMNMIVVDALDWASNIGEENGSAIEGIIAHELEHLLMNYSDPGELSWVDEGLADFAAFLNGYYGALTSHLVYHQVFHRDTSLTRWGGTLQNYGASYTFFQYLWTQAGGNGDGNFAQDFDYDGVAGDLLIKLIFEEQADGMDGVQTAIDEFNAQTRADLPSAVELFENWVVAVYLDDENSDTFDINEVDFGSADSLGWTIDIGNEVFYDGRGIYKGAMPDAKWRNFKRVPAQNALPFGTSYEVFRNPGPTFSLTLDGSDTTGVSPHSGDLHWYGGYESQSDNVLNVDAAVAGGNSFDFWSWYFIEEGWDYGFVEALVDGDWVTVPLYDDAGNEVTTNDNPQGNNTEGNGLTGTSGGAYFVDEPQYIHLNGTVPDGATDLRFRYSTDAAYLDTGWFVDDVSINGVAVDENSDLTTEEGNWVQTNGQQDNNWVAQIIAPCDLTPGATTDGEIVDNAGNYVYRFEGDDISVSGFSTKCLNGPGKKTITVAISNMPGGLINFLDAPYTFRVTNTGNKKK
ncbi:MAG TPA: hypothetical protein VFV93_07365, partial [Thermomicrobiales bacterium]|nr:hypothetical protein [Thermomicrobiales bacterium]